MNDKTIEQEIQAKDANVAPRITPADIEANIVSEHFFTAEQAVTGFHEDMVGRFLAWRLPKDFAPDGYIKFSPPNDLPISHYPTGTNLLHAGQAKEMLEYVAGVSPAAPQLSLLTFCVIVLRNGFTVTGESACASPENFNAEIGRQIARQNAVAKIWPLLGYELRTKLAGT